MPKEAPSAIKEEKKFAVEPVKEAIPQSNYNPNARFKCTTCEVSFTNKARLQKHLVGASHKEVEKNQIAAKSAFSRVDFNKKHDPTGEGIPFAKCEELQIWPYGECYECQLGLTTAESIKNHAIKVHGGVSFTELDKRDQACSKAAWDIIYANFSASQDSNLYSTCNYCTF